MDNITSIDVVTLKGEILTTNASQNLELFRALKGGGNNFGIVTKWTIKTHEQKETWDRRWRYQEAQLSKVEAAVYHFSTKVHDDRPAYLENKFEWTCKKGKLEASALAVCFYDKPSAQVPAIFKELDELEHKDDVEDLQKLEFRGRYACLMLSGYTEALINKIAEVIKEAAKDLPDHSGLQLYTNLKLVSKHIFDGVEANSSAWPHEKDKPNFPLPICCKWTSVAHDEFWLKKFREMTTTIKDYAIKEKCSTENAPIYPGLALDGTTSKEIYGDNLKWLGPLRSKHDPNDLIKLTGGFRV